MIRVDSGLVAVFASAPIHTIDYDDRVTLSYVNGWYFVVFNNYDIAVSSNDPFELLKYLLSSNDPDDRHAAQLLVYHLIHCFFRIDLRDEFNVNVGAIVKIRRLWAYDYENDYFYNQLVITVTINNKIFELAKLDPLTKGFLVKYNKYAKTRGEKKKMLAELRRALGMTKKEFTVFMGWLGSFW